MARGKKTGGKDYSPGNPGGPGRPVMSPEQREMRKLTRTQINDILNRYFWATPTEIELAKEDPALSIGERGVISILKLAVETGDQSRIEWIFQRLVGKVPDKIEHSGGLSFQVKASDGRVAEFGVKEDE